MRSLTRICLGLIRSIGWDVHHSYGDSKLEPHFSVPLYQSLNHISRGCVTSGGLGSLKLSGVPGVGKVDLHEIWGQGSLVISFDFVPISVDSAVECAGNFVGQCSCAGTPFLRLELVHKTLARWHEVTSQEAFQQAAQTERPNVETSVNVAKSTAGCN